MKIAVMTDQNSGFSEEQVKALGIFQLKMPVIIDGKDYFEGVDLTHEDFYNAMMAGKDITTSQPSPGDVMDMWESILNEGYDELVYIPMSSGLSTSCQNALSLMDDYDGRVQVVDNHRISVTMQQSVIDALKMAENGLSARRIKECLENSAYDASIYIAVDTLEYLVKSGRVTAAGAALGNMLSIKPILTIQGDKLDAYAKVRGAKKCEAKIMEALKNDLNGRFADVDRNDLAVFTAGTFLDPMDAKRWLEIVRSEFSEFDSIEYSQLSLSIGSHVGPNSFAVAVAKKYK